MLVCNLFAERIDLPLTSTTCCFAPCPTTDDTAQIIVTRAPTEEESRLMQVHPYPPLVQVAVVSAARILGPGVRATDNNTIWSFDVSAEEELKLLELSKESRFSMIRTSMAAATPTTPNATNTPYPSFLNSKFVNVVGLNKVILAGSQIKDEDIVMLLWPESRFQSSYISAPDQVRLMYAKTDLLDAGLPLSSRQLSSKSVPKHLTISSGNRGVSFRVNEESEIEGNLEAGAYVNIFTESANTRTTRSPLLSSVRVVAWGGLSPEENSAIEFFPHNPVREITLDLSPSNALLIARAKHAGSLSVKVIGSGGLSDK